MVQRSRAHVQVYGGYSKAKKYIKYLVKWQIKQKLVASQQRLCFWLETIWTFVKEHTVRLFVASFLLLPGSQETASGCGCQSGRVSEGISPTPHVYSGTISTAVRHAVGPFL